MISHAMRERIAAGRMACAEELGTAEKDVVDQLRHANPVLNSGVR